MSYDLYMGTSNNNLHHTAPSNIGTFAIKDKIGKTK